MKEKKRKTQKVSKIPARSVAAPISKREIIHTYAPLEVISFIDKQAALQFQSRTEFIRNLLVDYYNKFNKDLNS